MKETRKYTNKCYVFKTSKLKFHFSTYCPNSFKRLSYLSTIVGHRHNLAAGSFVINNTFSATRKLLTPNIYCSSHKTFVTIHRTHLRINAICSKSFCPQKRITACCLLREVFNGNDAIFNAYK